ncbi:hybrid-cluster NAD(P)-dependent oxidoreductase [Streptomyces sp. NPDC006990]|uniref:hybrid-cluster NAD(P)-dependent oxidoreductase n=1 Tax=Streptomyces sp. NPDC006990 TaxID=3154481 RepID=UPI0034537B8E
MNDVLTDPGREALRQPGALRPADGATDGPADHVLVCKQVHDVNHDTKTFAFEPAGPGVLRHDPGQYLAFTFEIDGREFSRCYTLSSPPSRPHLAAITVKRVPGGRVSNWLHDVLAPGAVVRARGPMGRFSTARHPAPAYLFLSGGSGATPLMSMTRTLYDLASPADVAFVHSARTPADIPFRQELALMAATAPAIRVAHVCEDDGRTERWHGHRGRLSLGMLQEIVPDLLEREVFCCGPAGYMRAVRRMLHAAGHPEARYHEESFEAPAPGPGTASGSVPVPGSASGSVPVPGTALASALASGSGPVRSAEDSGPAPRFTVELSRSGATIECEAGTPVLEAAARAGITLPSSCGEGLCGTCVTTLHRGSVTMRHQGGLRPRDSAQNKILLCCATPLENLVIDA